ncbi:MULTISPECIES: hypothetical protein [Clostridium]|nr:MULTISPECIES: hypothetical protein [Clostridium]MDB2104873.1 hypothetical protein [Clostridium paraputrificum]MDC0802085.1 hypothetical protein [Clostridium paraputrificum]MDU7215576.1 hypothetical protein [Clostridium sp.]
MSRKNNEDLDFNLEFDITAGNVHDSVGFVDLCKELKDGFSYMSKF